MGANKPSLPSTLEAAKSILVVDDMTDRFAALTRKGILASASQVAHAKNALEALEHLDKPWDAIFLDYDLDTEISDPDPRQITGADVAYYITLLHYKPVVIIHSMNPKGAKQIEALLKKHDVPCVRLPIMAFTDWIPA